MDTQVISTIVVSVFASTGFWAFITALMQRRDKKDNKVSLEGKMLRGLAHDRICYLGEQYIKKGYITKEDYENFYEYLWKPYEELGGNGTAQRIMEEVKRLPLNGEEEKKNG